ncbi:hypothetical protein KPC_2311 [Acinetobacter stercoris]|uniref:Uncharacterized protein n=1 Tax=Acinetobacter stercoris TaxID=2126983 RepID=A0A2U3N0H9_9GAMM|nr:hypothetical protein KPC_2311 [Acinetobacter stercoris]
MAREASPRGMIDKESAQVLTAFTLGAAKLRVSRVNCLGC